MCDKIYSVIYATENSVIFTIMNHEMGHRNPFFPRFCYIFEIIIIVEIDALYIFCKYFFNDFEGLDWIF